MATFDFTKYAPFRPIRLSDRTTKALLLESAVRTSADRSLPDAAIAPTALRRLLKLFSANPEIAV